MTYVMNLQRYKSIGTQWVVLYADSNNVTSFDSLGVEYISHDIGNFIKTSKWFNKWVDNFALDLLILCSKEKSALDYADLFSPNKCEKNDKSNIFLVTQK